MRLSPLHVVLLASLASLAAVPAQAQKRVRLELRPQAGDTLRMVVEQQTEMTGSGSEGASHSVSTRMRMTTRAIVLSRGARSAELLSITDTVAISTTDPHGKPMVDQLIRQLEGRTLRMQLSPDGTARILPEKGASAARANDVAELVAAMPAAFPAHPVAVGERWTRELAIPGASGRSTFRDGGVFRATFRLDSLSADDSLAWISMKGEIGRSLGATRGEGEMRGTLLGTMLLDRVRGWLADSRTMVVVNTTLATATGTEPMKFITRITQRVRTSPR